MRIQTNEPFKLYYASMFFEEIASTLQESIASLSVSASAPATTSHDLYALTCNVDASSRVRLGVATRRPDGAVTLNGSSLHLPASALRRDGMYQQNSKLYFLDNDIDSRNQNAESLCMVVHGVLAVDDAAYCRKIITERTCLQQKTLVVVIGTATNKADIISTTCRDATFVQFVQLQDIADFTSSSSQNAGVALAHRDALITGLPLSCLMEAWPVSGRDAATWAHDLNETLSTKRDELIELLLKHSLAAARDPVRDVLAFAAPTPLLVSPAHAAELPRVISRPVLEPRGLDRVAVVASASRAVELPTSPPESNIVMLDWASADGRIFTPQASGDIDELVSQFTLACADVAGASSDRIESLRIVLGPTVQERDALGACVAARRLLCLHAPWDDAAQPARRSVILVDDAALRQIFAELCDLRSKLESPRVHLRARIAAQKLSGGAGAHFAEQSDLDFLAGMVLRARVDERARRVVPDTDLLTWGVLLGPK